MFFLAESQIADLPVSPNSIDKKERTKLKFKGVKHDFFGIAEHMCKKWYNLL